MEAMGVIVLITTFLLSSKKKYPVWKANTLATMFHGPEHSKGTQAAAADKLSVMETYAEKSKMKLAATPHGY